MKTLAILVALALATPAHAQMDREEQRMYDQSVRELDQEQSRIDMRFMSLNAEQDRMRMLQQNDELIRIQREMLRRQRQR